MIRERERKKLVQASPGVIFQSDMAAYLQVTGFAHVEGRMAGRPQGRLCGM